MIGTAEPAWTATAYPDGDEKTPGAAEFRGLWHVLFPQPITHPVLADTSPAVSRAFGVLDEPLGIAFRATVIVEPDARIRATPINAPKVGRSPAATLHTLKTGELCSADWHKGDRYAA